MSKIIANGHVRTMSMSTLNNKRLSTISENGKTPKNRLPKIVEAPSKLSQKPKSKLMHLRQMSSKITNATKFNKSPPRKANKRKGSRNNKLEYKKTTNFEMFDNSRFTPSNHKHKTNSLRLGSGSSRDSHKSFKSLKQSLKTKATLKTSMNAKKQMLKKLEQALVQYNQHRKEFRKYLICMHIFKTGILKLSYLIYKRRKMKKDQSKKFTILISTKMISYLKHAFTVDSLMTDQFVDFMTQFKTFSQRSRRDEQMKSTDRQPESLNFNSEISNHMLYNMSIGSKIAKMLKEVKTRNKPPLATHTVKKSVALPHINSKESLEGSSRKMTKIPSFAKFKKLNKGLTMKKIGKKKTKRISFGQDKTLVAPTLGSSPNEMSKNPDIADLKFNFLENSKNAVKAVS